MTPHHPLWHGTEPLVLASHSAARRAVLQAAGIPVDATAAQVDERSIEKQLVAASEGHNTVTPDVLATKLASAKALDVSRRHPGRFVLGGDQVLTCGQENQGFQENQRFHKPETRDNAARQLAQLAGRHHRLTSAACLARDGVILDTCASHAVMTMRALTPDQIWAYLAAAGNGILASAGGYHIEGLGVHLFETIEGDHFTIQGLPLLGVLNLLRHQGLLA